MAIKRELWNFSFQKKKFPAWPCPRCGAGLSGPDPQTFCVVRDVESNRLMPRQEFSPHDVNGTFSCQFKCRMSDCGETISCCGSYGVDQDWDPENRDTVWVDFFRPLYFVPAIEVFTIPKKCPKEVMVQVKAAFALHWSDPWSSANRVRAGVESILDHTKIPRTKTGGKKRVRLSLHDRIQLYGSRTGNARVASMLMAVKWLGNAGSHASPMSADDLFDGFDMMEHVLKALFDTSEAELLRLSRKINKRKGPIARAKK